MNKAGLIKQIADRAGIPQKDAEEHLTVILRLIREALVAGDKVSMMGFGNFRTHKRRARVGRNPKTGAPVQITAMAIPKFRANKLFLDRLNRHPIGR